MDVVAREYFRSLNSMTRRVIDAKVETSTGHSSSEKTTVRDENFPYRCIPFGVKIFEDADKHVWRDEHSAPFSWETQSQLNIAIRLDKSGTKPVRFQSAQHLDSQTVPLSAMLNAAKEGNLNYNYKDSSSWTIGKPLDSSDLHTPQVITVAFKILQSV